MRYAIASLCLIISSSICFAQVPPTLWTKHYGGIYYDDARSIEETSDGGFIIGGYTDSSGTQTQYDFYLVRTDSNGDTIWTRTYGGTGSYFCMSVKQTPDSGFIAAGWFATGPPDWIIDGVLIKTDQNGNPIWTRSYGDSLSDQFESVDCTADGGYIAVGYSNSYGADTIHTDSDVWAVKTDNIGNPIWSTVYGGVDDDEGYSVQQTSDGGYIISGFTESFGAGESDMYLIKTGSSGGVTWTETYGGTNDDVGYSVQQTADNGYVIGGYTFKNDGGTWYRHAYLVKTDINGDTLWTNAWRRASGGSSGYNDCRSVKQTSDGGYIVGGNDDRGSGSLYLAKTDSTGDTLWTAIYGHLTYSDWGTSVTQTLDGGYVIAGFGGEYSGGDAYVVKVASETMVIPTLSEWGMLILGLLLLAVGTVAVVRRRKAVVKA